MLTDAEHTQVAATAARLREAIAKRNLSACYREIWLLRPPMIEIVMVRAGFAMIGARSRGFGQYVQRALSQACGKPSEVQGGDHGQD
ncbi:hypothetical protein ACPPTR_06050 [Ralstonia pseudosolanacearum]|uniref:hypothetical protein n=1 Tax=Ralstonia pseudosolanacearum TaxID=1310165 RepID=UPI000B92EB97|nr:hypothetical protein [Ralstonia pseudosolanacearum]MCD9230453.1 hypothetical protein [Ralstonia pseudosolanacearum]